MWNHSQIFGPSTLLRYLTVFPWLTFPTIFNTFFNFLPSQTSNFPLLFMLNKWSFFLIYRENTNHSKGTPFFLPSWHVQDCQATSTFELFILSKDDLFTLTLTISFPLPSQDQNNWLFYFLFTFLGHYILRLNM